MRKTTRKTVFLLTGILAVAGLLQAHRLHRRLTVVQRQRGALEDRHIATLRWLRRLHHDAAGPGHDDVDASLPAEERRYYQRRIQRMEERIAFLETAAATLRARPSSATETDTDSIGAVVHAALAAAPAEVLWPLLTRPELRELLRMHLQTTLEEQYEPLFAFFDFVPADEQTLIALLIEKKWIAMNRSLLALQTEVDPEWRRIAMEALQADRDDLDWTLHDFLGAEDFAVFVEYEQTQPERARVNELRRLLIPHAAPLSAIQEHALIIALHEERNALAGASDNTVGNGAIDARVPLPHDAVALLLQRSLERAEAILTPEQMEVFVPFAQVSFALEGASFHQD